MATSEFRQVVSVFLASPGDLKDEREIAKELVARFNRRYSRFFNLTVELVIWEDVPSGHGRPQEIINRDHLARCELFVGMLHERWGSGTGKFSSGFEEEFSISEESLRATGRPAMGILFKHVDEVRTGDPGKEFAKVLAFKTAIGDRILHKTFKSEAEFTNHFEDILSAHVLGLKTQQIVQSAQVERELSPVEAGETLAEAEGVPQLPPEGITFLRAFAAKARSASETSPLTRVEVARFRLLSTMVSDGNDESDVGVHDANALFTHRNEIDLAPRECFGLVDAGLANFKNENVPLWHWLKRVNALDGPSLGMRSLFGPQRRRVGSLRLMKLLKHPIVEADIFNRTFYLKNWFQESNSSAVKEAALEYLAVCGSDADLDAVRKEVDAGGYQTQKAANHAYVRILQRRNSNDALGALVELDFEGVTDDVVGKVFERPEILATETLTAATAHRSIRVRRAAASTLRARKALTKDLADRLSGDDAPSVRFEALSARVEAGEILNEDAVKAVLVRKKNSSRGLFGLGALSFGALGETEGEEQLAQFRSEAVTRLSGADLKRRAAGADILNQDLVFEQIRRVFAKRGDELRDGLGDLFKSWFDREFEAFSARGFKEETLIRLRGVEDTLRKEWTRAALDIVTARKQAGDLNLIRKVLASDYINPTIGDMRFLAAVGEWSDIRTVLAFSDSLRGNARRGILGSYLSDDDSAVVASCVCSIAKTRLFELLGMEVSAGIRAWIVRLAPGTAIKALKNVQILTFLGEQNDDFRRAIVLRVIGELGTARIAGLFRAYMGFERDRYYNVTVWLDMAMSIERYHAIEISKAALAEADR